MIKIYYIIPTGYDIFNTGKQIYTSKFLYTMYSDTKYQFTLMNSTLINEIQLTVLSHQMWKTIQDPVLHIELRRWADILVIAPLDCNTLAKISNGICDNLLVSYIQCFLKGQKILQRRENTCTRYHGYIHVNMT